jgi:sec-independent protein translocase protein TatB
MFELSFEKLLVIGLLAAFLLGPQHLPRYAAQLARLVRVVRHMASDARGRLEEELGPDFDADLRRLDPRQYDPRRILRDALTTDEEEPVPDPVPARSAARAPVVDDEAT